MRQQVSSAVVKDAIGTSDLDQYHQELLKCVKVLKETSGNADRWVTRGRDFQP